MAEIPEAFVYDAIRTPRGKGKANGSLHEVKPVDLVVGLIDEMRARHPELDPSRIDDVVLGVRLARSATRAATSPRPPRIAAGLPDTVAGVQLNRFCASGLEAVNIGRAEGRAPAGRTWSSPAASSRCRACRWAPTAAPGRWTRRPNYDTGFVPQGIGADLIATLEGFTREDVDAYAVELAGRAPRRRGPTATSPARSSRSRTSTASSCSTTTSSSAPARPSRALGGLQAVVRRRSARWAASTPWRCRSTTGSRRSTTSTTPATPPASSTAPRWWRSATSRPATTLGLTPRARIVADRASPAPTRRSCSPAPRPPRRKALAKAGLDRRRHRPRSRSTRRSPPSCCASCSDMGISTRRRSTSTAARSPWATRSARPAR